MLTVDRTLVVMYFTRARSTTTLVAALLLLSTLPALSGGFPGKGEVADWSNALPYYNHGNHYLNQQRFADAARRYREAIERYPYDPDFYINLGVACRKLEDYVGEEEAFKAALALNDKDWMSWNNLGNAYLKQNRLKETLNAFERALKCNPPASEKIGLQRDITDIHKMLRNTGQEPMPDPSANSKQKTAPGKRKATAPTPAKRGASLPSGKPAPSTAPTKDWGYE